MHVLTICCCVQETKMTISKHVVKKDILYAYPGEINWGNYRAVKHEHVTHCTEPQQGRPIYYCKLFIGIHAIIAEAGGLIDHHSACLFYWQALDRKCVLFCVCVCGCAISHGGLPGSSLAGCGVIRPRPPACNESNTALPVCLQN